jgi:hypothetical protein
MNRPKEITAQIRWSVRWATCDYCDNLDSCHLFSLIPLRLTFVAQPLRLVPTPPGSEPGLQPQSSHGMTNMQLLSDLPKPLNHPSAAAYSAAYSPLIQPTY